MPEATVLIPTRGRPEKLGWCAAALARQEGASPEVLVGLDGPDPAAADAARDAWERSGGSPGALTVIALPNLGYNAARNALLQRARGRVLISLNDDLYADPGLVRAHVSAHKPGARVVVVSGRSRWRRHEPETVFDRMVRLTPMIFFDAAMDDADPERDWGFRHAWGLNMSAPADAVREVGGWTAFERAYGYDDIELAHRLRERFEARVLHRPDASGEHDHRYGVAEYLGREFRLGASALHFARRRPRFGLDLFGRDITADPEIEYSRAFVERERTLASTIEKTLREIGPMPASVLDGEGGEALLRALYEHHLPLKRWMWRRGLLASAAGNPCAAPDFPGT
jgi:glycosyltransferase involved in cell wall biosynthesis